MASPTRYDPLLSWEGHRAEELLGMAFEKGDVWKPSWLYILHEEYQLFPYDVFKKHYRMEKFRTKWHDRGYAFVTPERCLRIRDTGTYDAGCAFVTPERAPK
jgi:hypothetical protein